MTNEDLAKLLKDIKQEIRGVKDLVEVIKKKVDSNDLFISAIAANVRSIKEQQSVINEKLDQHTEALVTIERTSS